MSISDRTIAEICSKFRISGSLDTGLLAGGVDRVTFDAWAAAYRNGEAEPMQARLVTAVLEAEGELKLLREHQLASYFEKNWQALAWWLERKYPDEYGPKAKTGDAKPAASSDEVDELFNLLPTSD